MRFIKPKKRRELRPKGYGKIRAEKDVQIIKEKRKYKV